VKGKRRTATVLALQIAILLLFFGLWEVLSRSGLLRDFIFSRPSKIGHQLGSWLQSGFLWPHVFVTLQETVLAFGYGMVAGVITGFLLARVPLLSSIFGPFIQMLNALPRVVLAPVFIVLFGTGTHSKIALGFSLVFFIVFYNTYRGVKDVDRTLINKARMLGANEWQLTRHVLMPSALTWILASLHTSVGFALGGVVVAEYIQSTRGIGHLIALYEGNFNSTGMFAGMAVLLVVILCVEVGIVLLERRLLVWQPNNTAQG